jgi:hypothetical protein
MGTCKWLYKQELQKHVPKKLKTVQNLVRFEDTALPPSPGLMWWFKLKNQYIVCEPDDMDKAAFQMLSTAKQQLSIKYLQSNKCHKLIQLTNN